MGYGLSSPQLADILNRVRQPFNNNTPALAAAVAALSDDEHLQQTITVNAQGMQQLTDGFKNLGPGMGALGREFCSGGFKASGIACL